MRRALIRLLLLGLTPVLVVAAAPDLAQAATQYGSETTFTIGWGESEMGDAVSCGLGAYWKRVGASPPSIELRGNCGTGWNVASAEASFTATGGGCAFAGGPAKQVDGVAVSDSLVPVVGDWSCVVSEVCVHVHTKVHSNPWFDGWYDVCVAVALGAPPEASEAAPAGCPLGGPTGKPTYGAPYLFAQDSTRRQWVVDVTMTVHSTSLNAGGPWLLYGVSAVSPETTIWNTWVGDTVPLAPSATEMGVQSQLYWRDRLTGVVDQDVTVTWKMPVSARYTTGNQPAAPTTTLRGLGLIGIYQTAASALAIPSSDTSYGDIGRNQLDRCSYWYGPQLIKTGVMTQGSQAPTAPLGTGEPDVSDPAPDPATTPTAPADTSGCAGFSLFDATSWAGAGICELVKAVRALWVAVTGIANWLLGLMGDLRGMFVDLFVPHPSSWDFDGLMVQLENRPPASIMVDLSNGLGALGDQYGGAGCGTLVHFGGDLDKNVTCGAASSVPGYGALYSLMQVALWSVAGIGVYKLLAGVFEKG